jgi:hypothetical protein
MDDQALPPDELARRLAKMSAFDISVFLGTFFEEMASNHGHSLPFAYMEICDEAKRDDDFRVRTLISILHHRMFAGAEPAATLDTAHRALRGVDAADLSKPLPDKQINAVADAVEDIEKFSRDHGIVLSEFAR